MADTEPLDGYGDVPKDKTPAEKAAGAASFILFAGLTAGCMALEPAPGTADIGSESMWALGAVLGAPKLFAAVLLVNVLGTTCVMIFYLSFGFAGKARGLYGFPLPTMYAATDIYLLDVEAKGNLIGGGEGAAAERLRKATVYNCHQRAHQQPLETYTSFVALSLVSGLRYPLLTAIYGAMWCIARVFYSQGYATGNPIDRYNNKLFAMWVWYSLLGLLISTAGAAAAVAGF